MCCVGLDWSCYIVTRSFLFFFFFSSRRRHTRLTCDWSSDVCSSDLLVDIALAHHMPVRKRRRVKELAEGDHDAGAEPDSDLTVPGVLQDDIGLAIQIGRASCRKECRSRWSPYH